MVRKCVSERRLAHRYPPEHASNHRFRTGFARVDLLDFIIAFDLTLSRHGSVCDDSCRSRKWIRRVTH